MKKGLFTVSYAGLWGQKELSVPAIIRKAASMGYEGVLFMGKPPHLFPHGVDASRLEEIKEVLEETKITPVGIAAYNDFLVTGPAEVPLLEMQLAYIGETIRLAGRLGAPLVRLFTGYLSPNRSTNEGWNTVVSILRGCGEIAEDHGVTLAVQNHHDLAVHTEEMLLLLEEIDHPSVKAGFDAWSPYLRGEDLTEAAGKMAPWTAMSIVANYKRYHRYSYVPDLVNYARVEPDKVRATLIDEGEIDYQAFLSTLHDNGFDGWVVYEMCSPLIGGGDEANLDLHASSFVKWMDTHMQEQ
jgi:sugar phosphate isomerase/epimerase